MRHANPCAIPIVHTPQPAGWSGEAVSTVRAPLASTPVDGSVVVEIDGVQELEFTVSVNVLSLNEAPVMGASIVIRYVPE